MKTFSVLTILVIFAAFVSADLSFQVTADRAPHSPFISVAVHSPNIFGPGFNQIPDKRLSILIEEDRPAYFPLTLRLYLCKKKALTSGCGLVLTSRGAYAEETLSLVLQATFHRSHDFRAENRKAAFYATLGGPPRFKDGVAEVYIYPEYIMDYGREEQVIFLRVFSENERLALQAVTFSTTRPAARSFCARTESPELSATNSVTCRSEVKTHGVFNIRLPSVGIFGRPETLSVAKEVVALDASNTWIPWDFVDTVSFDHSTDLVFRIRPSMDAHVGSWPFQPVFYGFEFSEAVGELGALPLRVTAFDLRDNFFVRFDQVETNFVAIQHHLPGKAVALGESDAIRRPLEFKLEVFSPEDRAHMVVLVQFHDETKETIREMVTSSTHPWHQRSNLPKALARPTLSTQASPTPSPCGRQEARGRGIITPVDALSAGLA